MNELVGPAVFRSIDAMTIGRIIMENNGIVLPFPY
jgi:hypothetical protein